MLTEAERSAILDTEVMRWVANGYHVQTRTPTTAQLIRPKTFSVAAAVLWLLCLVVGLLIYLLMYAAQSDESVYLVVKEDGTITSSGSGIRQMKATDWRCDQCGRTNNEFRSLCKRCRAARP